MHPLLTINEMLERILLHSFDTSAPEGSIAACVARTCKAFTEPVLKLLWGTVEIKLSALLKLFPNLERRPTDGKYVKCISHLRKHFPDLTVQIFTRFLRPDDWERCEYYAKFVQKLDGKDESNFQWDESVMQALALYRPLNREGIFFPLLPNLHDLAWAHPSFQPAILFFCQTLVRVSFHGLGRDINQSHEAETDSVFHMLANMSPRLESFHYGGGHISLELARIITSNLTSLQDIGAFWSLDKSEALLTLATLPALKIFRVAPSYGYVDGSSNPDVRSETLRELHFTLITNKSPGVLKAVQHYGIETITFLRWPKFPHRNG
jgi:hypothetical protein